VSVCLAAEPRRWRNGELGLLSLSAWERPAATRRSGRPVLAALLQAAACMAQAHCGSQLRHLVPRRRAFFDKRLAQEVEGSALGEVRAQLCCCNLLVRVGFTHHAALIACSESDRQGVDGGCDSAMEHIVHASAMLEVTGGGRRVVQWLWPMAK